jgi:hypothetical protein
VRFGKNGPGNAKLLFDPGIMRAALQPGLNTPDPGPGLFGLKDAGTTEDDYRRNDFLPAQNDLGLEQLKLEAHRAQIIGVNEVIVVICNPVGR